MTPDICGQNMQVKYWEETGNSGFKVYKFECIRRPDQGELYSRALVFGGGQAPKHFTAETRKTQVSSSRFRQRVRECSHQSI